MKMTVADDPVGYSDAVIIHGPTSLVFLSGIVGHVTSGGMPIADVAGQTHQIFERMTHVLETAGGGLGQLVEIVTYVVDIGANLETVRQVRSVYLPSDALPASTMVGVDALVDPAMLVEVRAVAALEPPSSDRL